MQLFTLYYPKNNNKVPYKFIKNSIMRTDHYCYFLNVINDALHIHKDNTILDFVMRCYLDHLNIDITTAKGLKEFCDIHPSVKYTLSSGNNKNDGAYGDVMEYLNSPKEWFPQFYKIFFEKYSKENYSYYFTIEDINVF